MIICDRRFCCSQQRGNVLFIILIAIALLAALSYAVVQTSRGGTSAITDERAKLNASEILEYAQNIGNAFTQLRLRGCSDTQISFENPIQTGYENVSAPSDNTCHVFHPEGGGVSYQRPDQSFNDGTGVLATWFFDSRLSVKNIGSCDDASDADCKDLKIMLSVQKPICDQINRQIFGSIQDLDVTPDEDLSVFQYDGTYSGSAGLICNNTSPMRSWCASRTAFCGVYGDGNTGGPDPQYAFMKVLFSR